MPQAGRVVDRLDHVALAQVLLRRKEEVDHQLDHLARGEVLSGLLVGLLGADPDQLLEDVAHLDVVHARRGEVDGGEGLDDLVEQVLLGHAGDLLVEGELLHDVADVPREGVEVTVQVLRELVRVVEECGEVQFRQVVETMAGDLLEDAIDDGLRLPLDPRMLGEDPGLRRRQQAVKAPQDGQRENDLAVLVALVGPAQQVADPPDEGGDLGVGLRAHRRRRPPRKTRLTAAASKASGSNPSPTQSSSSSLSGSAGFRSASSIA